LFDTFSYRTNTLSKRQNAEHFARLVRQPEPGRNYNTQSIREAAEEAGIQPLFSNAEQKQENQIKAIRSFIVYQVDVIAFVPIVSTGWENVLREAKEAGIPVLVTDRKIDTQDESLYAGFIGTDSIQEGRVAGEFLLKKI
jgi:simple sugar transport system substrate-binding protein